jgi:hypothetical protein
VAIDILLDQKNTQEMTTRRMQGPYTYNKIDINNWWSLPSCWTRRTKRSSSRDHHQEDAGAVHLQQDRYQQQVVIDILLDQKNTQEMTTKSMQGPNTYNKIDINNRWSLASSWTRRTLRR